MRHVAAHHIADDAVLGDFLARQGRYGCAIADDGDTVGHAVDFVQLMADQDRGDPLRLQFQQQVQQFLTVVFLQGGGGLIKDQQAHILGKRLGDLDQLLLAHAQFAHLGARGFIQAHLAQQSIGFLERFRPVDHAILGDLVAEEQVLGNRQQRHQRQFLMDDDDATGLTVADRLVVQHLTVIQNFAFIGAVAVDARQHLHQGGFACAILTADGVNLSGLDRQVHIVQRAYARENLADPPHFQKCRHGCPLPKGIPPPALGRRGSDYLIWSAV